MNLSPVRAHGESQKAYRERQKINNRSMKHHLRHGYPLWTSCYLLTGEEMLREWLNKNPGATEDKVEQIRKHFPRHKLFKVKAQGTYRKKPVKDKPQSSPPSPAVLAAIKKCRRKKATAEARRVTKLAEKSK